MTCTALYPGTFDPITNGHIDLIKRAAPLFNHMHVAVANPSHKKPCLAREKRISLIQIALRALPFNISVIPLNGLLVNCMREQQAKVILRGVRAVSDFDYEFQMASMNRTMCPELETLFLTPAEEYANISSSMVREIARLGGDISAFVPHCVVHCVQNALAGKHGHGT